MNDNQVNPSAQFVNPAEPLWTVKEVAHYLRLKPETVRAMVRRGELPVLRVGKRILRFKREEVVAWVEEQKD